MIEALNTMFSMPLFWTSLTIFTFVLGQKLYHLLGNSAFLPPVMTSIALCALVLELSGNPFSVYMEGGQYLHWMLGPSVVMLAVPLYQHVHTIRKDWLRIALAIILGSSCTVVVAMLLAHYFIGDDVLTLTMATKSSTTAVAVVLAEQLGGISALASAFVMVTGIMGALIIPIILQLTKLDKPEAVGLALGVCAHGVGTGRALELGSKEAAYAAMAMSLTGSFFALLLPLIF